MNHMSANSMSIYEFKKGDNITRIEPSQPIPGFDDINFRDRAYIGISLVFLGIANGCVYVEKRHIKSELEDMPEIGQFFKSLLGTSTGPINLPLDIWSDGWSYYVDPYTIGDNKDNSRAISAKPIVSLEELKSQLSEALKKEDYKKAEKLQKMINNLK